MDTTVVLQWVQGLVACLLFVGVLVFFLVLFYVIVSADTSTWSDRKNRAMDFLRKIVWVAVVCVVALHAGLYYNGLPLIGSLQDSVSKQRNDVSVLILTFSLLWLLEILVLWIVARKRE
jgi:cytochrome bd-type quinol oxidase subunit 2